MRSTFSPHTGPRDLRRDAGRNPSEAGNFGPGPAVRLLPPLIVAALCMLGFRVQLVVKDVAHIRTTSLEVAPSTALAQAAAPAAQPAAANANGMPAPAAPGAAPAGAQAPAAPAAGQNPPAEGTATDAAAPGGGTAVKFDPSTLSKAEIETLQRLAERRDLIDKREREIEAKDGLLKAAESRIDGKIAELQDLEKNIKGLLQQYDGQKQQELDQLVRIYSAMKPKEAAAIFETLDMPTLLGIVQKMKDRTVAPIMAAMSPAKATALTEEITSRKQLSAASK